jgi:hypothetical protein
MQNTKILSGFTVPLSRNTIYIFHAIQLPQFPLIIKLQLIMLGLRTYSVSYLPLHMARATGRNNKTSTQFYTLGLTIL